MPGPAYGLNKNQIRKARRVSRARGVSAPRAASVVKRSAVYGRRSRATKRKLHSLYRAQWTYSPITRKPDPLMESIYSVRSQQIAGKKLRAIEGRLAKTSHNFARKVAKTDPKVIWNANLASLGVKNAAGAYSEGRIYIPPETTKKLLNIPYFPKDETKAERRSRRRHFRDARGTVIHELAHAAQDNPQGKKFYDRSRKKILKGQMLRGKKLRKALLRGYAGIRPFDHRTIVEAQAELYARKAERRAYRRRGQDVYDAEVRRFKRLRLGR